MSQSTLILSMHATIATSQVVIVKVMPTHAGGDDGQSQVVGVHDVRHEQEVHVAAVTRQQNHWVLLNGLLQLEAEGTAWSVRAVDRV